MSLLEGTFRIDRSLGYDEKDDIWAARSIIAQPIGGEPKILWQYRGFCPVQAEPANRESDSYLAYVNLFELFPFFQRFQRCVFSLQASKNWLQFFCEAICNKHLLLNPTLIVNTDSSKTSEMSYYYQSQRQNPKSKRVRISHQLILTRFLVFLVLPSWGF